MDSPIPFENSAVQTLKRPRVSIIIKSFPHYRKPFFDQLRQRLDKRGVELELVYGQPIGGDSKKGDTVDLPWAQKIRNKTFSLGNKTLVWQPAVGKAMNADLVIVEQASKLILNYLLWPSRRLFGTKLAFWGHGRNFQGHTAHALGEKLKMLLSRHVDWWFSYNKLSTQVINEDIGFPKGKITTVQNAIDTKALQHSLKSLRPQHLNDARAQLGIKSQNVAIFAGGMYEEKRLGFLLDACEKIRAQVPDFEMIFIGSGEQKSLVEEAAAQYDWIHYLGPKFGGEKVLYFALAKVMLMPGLVGLGILDSFALQVPLITTDIDYHSPEIAYLQPGENGVLVEEAHSSAAYASAVAELLQNEALHDKLKTGCAAASERYTLETMVSRFEQGVATALAL